MMVEVTKYAIICTRDKSHANVRGLEKGVCNAKLRINMQLKTFTIVAPFWSKVDKIGVNSGRAASFYP